MIILQYFGEERFLPPLSTLQKFLPFVCAEDPFVCENVIELICGKHNGAFSNSRIPIIQTHKQMDVNI